MTAYRLERGTVVPRPLDEVFSFFADPRNLSRITPPWLAFEMVGFEAPAGNATVASAHGVETGAGPIMQQGLLLHYRVRPLLVPQRWTSLIAEWDPPHRFVDEQVRGPYRSWRHLHEFRAVEGGTEVVDRVDYALPLGPLGRLAHLLLVERQLRRIFEFRRHAMDALFGTNQGTEQP